MKEVIKIKETCLYLNDLEQAKAFYHDKLGFEIIHYQPTKHLFFKVGSSVLLCFNPDDSKLKISPPPHYAEGNQHFAFEVSQNDYEKCKNKVIEMGIEIIDSLIWKSGQESFYFKDPENNVLEFVPEGFGVSYLAKNQWYSLYSVLLVGVKPLQASLFRYIPSLTKSSNLYTVYNLVKAHYLAVFLLLYRYLPTPLLLFADLALSR